MASRTKNEQYERYHCGKPISLVHGDIEGLTCPDGKGQHILWDIDVRGFGIRVTPTGRKTFVVQKTAKTTAGLKSFKHNLGSVEGLTLEAARDTAKALIAGFITSGMTPSESEQAKQAEERAAKEKAQAEERAKAEAKRLEAEKAAKYCLGALCTAYWQVLERQGKPSAKAARNALSLHVIKNKPDIAAKVANQVTRKDITSLLEAMTSAGIGRTTGTVRSYLVAAYNMAIQSEGDVSANASMMGFEVEYNPAQATNAKPVRRLSQARARTLDKTELMHYMKGLEDMPDSLARDALLLSLHTGGQRFQQLLRIERSDYDRDEATLTLRDTKGNRDAPRLHVVPLTAAAVEIVERLDRRAASRKQIALFCSTTKNGAILNGETVSTAGNKLAADMYADGRARAAFLVMDIRRTVETMLARAKVSKDIRAQLQSHGLSGVQAKHYDKHDYLEEKRAALGLWACIMEDSKQGRTTAPKVVYLGDKQLVNSSKGQ